MQMFKGTFKAVAKTFFGLEDVLYQEVVDLGAKNVRRLNRAIEFDCDMAMLYKANLKLRTALSVITPIYKFKAKTNDELYKAVLDFNWAGVFNLHQTFSVHAVVNSTFFDHSQYVALKAKDAIADHFRKKYNQRPNVDRRFADVRLVLHVNQDSFSVNIDTSGKALFQRGYKTELTEAPLNEVMAAGIILMSGWDKQTPFYDLMCGSGTILVEAAMIAANYPAGMMRKRFGFQNLKNYDASLWKSIVDEATSEINRDIPPIYGNDIDEEVIAICKQNISNTSFKHHIKLKCSDFMDYRPKTKTGLIITNPPYDARLKSENIHLLYENLGNKLKNDFLNYQCWVFSGNIKALKSVGLKTSKRIKLLNGAIESRLNLYEMYEGSKKAKYQSED